MKKFIIVVVMVSSFLFCKNSSAIEVDTSSLSEEQKAQLVLKAEEMKKEKISEEKISSAEKVNEWVDVGKNIGLALASTASQIGVAGDELLQSTTGKIAIVIILWKVMGNDLLGVFIGVGMFLCLFPCWLYMFRKMCLISNIKVTGEGKEKKVEYEHYKQGSVDETRFFMIILLLIISGVSILIAI